MPPLGMRTLQAFQPTSISMQAEFTVRGDEIHLLYALHDPKGEVLDSLAPGKWAVFPRADELWKTTCFEAFWGAPGKSRYWELNLSPVRKSWNLYVFDEYRKPQPPTPAHDFELISAVCSEDRLEATLACGIQLPRLEVSLTAVIRTASATNYFALRHAQPKPDFHRRETFVLGI